MQSQGYNISSELQKGINQINPSIKIKTNISNVKKDIQNLLKDLKANITTTLDLSFIRKAKGGIFSNGSWKNKQMKRRK